MDKNMVGSTVFYKHKDLEQSRIQSAQKFESLGLCIIDNLLKTCRLMHLTKEIYPNMTRIWFGAQCSTKTISSFQIAILMRKIPRNLLF